MLFPKRQIKWCLLRSFGNGSARVLLMGLFWLHLRSAEQALALHSVTISAFAEKATVHLQNYIFFGFA